MLSHAVLLDEEISEVETDGLLAKPEWQLACRVAASKGLNKSELLPKFLLYVCEQYLLDRAHEVTEQRIGIQVFNRPEGYNPGEDNIVRSYARLLRKRLDQYFEGEGRDEALRIAIPRGGYLPVFEHNFEVPEPESESSDFQPPVNFGNSEARLQDAAVSPKDLPETATLRPKWNPVWVAAFLGLFAGILLTALVWIVVRSAAPSSVAQSPGHAIWSQVFQPNRNTLIVASDSGLGIIENLTDHLVSIEEYANQSYLSDLKAPPGIDPRNFNDLRRQRYTSVVSLDITSRLTRLPEFIANRAQIRYARSITAEDIKNANVILIGSKHTNPWVALFEKRLNFNLEYTPEVDQSYVQNEHPTGAEQQTYRNGTDPESNRTYGSIAFLPGLDGAGHVLIIQGLNMAATQAAADALFDSKLMNPILQQATSPNGTIKPFELLIETSSIGATAPGAQVIATRVYSQ